MGAILVCCEINLVGELEQIFLRLFPSGDAMTRLGDM